MQIQRRFGAAVLGAVALTLLTGGSTPAATLEATYLFNNSLNAQQSGVPALVSVDPLASNQFNTATVFGQTRTVFSWVGNTTPAEQAGLSLNTTGLIPANNYSVELVFQFTQNANAWRRILDVQNRQSDNGFYVDPGNHLDVFPVAGGTTTFTNNAFHHVVLTDSGGTVNAYLDGNLEFTATTNVMDINNPGNLLNFFLDNVVGGGQGEFSDGSIALARLYQGALTPSEVAQLAADPFAGTGPPPPPPAVPEPSSLALLSLGGCALAGWRRWRKRTAA